VAEREKQCPSQQGHGPHGWREGPDDRSPMLYCHGVGLWAATEQALPLPPLPPLPTKYRRIGELSVEQQIRARAVDAAASLFLAINGHPIDAEPVAESVLAIAQSFADYIENGNGS